LSSPKSDKPVATPAPSRRLATIAAVLAGIAIVIAALGWFGIGPLQGQTGGRPDRITIESRGGGRHVFTVEWAVTEAERSQGLMFRQQMAEDHGMIFDFGSQQPLTFWMKNTPLSLDMIFIHEDGTIYRIEQRTTPFSENTVPSGASVRYVLEVLGGTSRKLGIQAGDRVRLR
jgi:uncharacterized membrane protein (UPF0127 family)